MKEMVPVAFVFETMEPERPKADQVMLGSSNRMRCSRRLTISDDGVARLNPEVARPVTGAAGRGQMLRSWADESACK